MTEDEASALLTRLFAALLDPSVPAEALEGFLTEDYLQIADGKRLDRSGFIDHARTLKSVIAQASVTFEKVVASDSTVASIHVARLRKTNGEVTELKVLAFFEIENSRVRRVEELTHLLHGSEEDRDLGSRTTG